VRRGGAAPGGGHDEHASPAGARGRLEPQERRARSRCCRCRACPDGYHRGAWRAGKDPLPTLPARYVRVAALRLRHHLTTLQNALIRNVSPLDQHKDQQALEAIAAALDLLRSYENAHRDEELDMDATDELRRELLQGCADGAKRLTESSSIAVHGDTSVPRVRGRAVDHDAQPCGHGWIPQLVAGRCVRARRDGE
jgi:hypothetical protein